MQKTYLPQDEDADNNPRTLTQPRALPPQWFYLLFFFLFCVCYFLFLVILCFECGSSLVVKIAHRR